jgi:hypothetical protein
MTDAMTDIVDIDVTSSSTETQAPETPAPVEPNDVSLAARLLVGGGVAVSIIAHVVLGGVVLLASPRSFATAPPDSITVDIVPPKDLDQDDKSQSETDKKTPGSAPDSTTQTQQAQTQQTQTQQTQQAQTQQPQVQPSSQQSPWQAPQQQHSSSLPAPRVAPPLPQMPLQPSPPKSVSQPPQPPSAPNGDPATAQSQVAQSQNDTAQTAAAASAGADEPAAEAARIVENLHLPMQVGSAPDAPPSDDPSKLTAEEIAGFKGHLKKCWVPPAQIPEASDLRLVVRVFLGPNGQLKGNPEVVQVNRASLGVPLAQSVLRALAQCQPFGDLPAAKYDEWKVLDLTFSQDEIGGVGPAVRGKGGSHG